MNSRGRILLAIVVVVIAGLGLLLWFMFRPTTQGGEREQGGGGREIVPIGSGAERGAGGPREAFDPEEREAASKTERLAEGTSDAAPRAGLAALELVVLDPLGEAVADARVRLLDVKTAERGESRRGASVDRELRTDSHGRLTARDLDPSLDTIEVIAAGRGWARHELSLSAGEETELTLALLDFCKVWFRVYADGEKLPAARIRIVAALDTVVEATADESGRFRIFELPGFTASLDATHPAHEATEMVIGLEPGSVLSRDIHMGECARIEGRILAEDGTALSSWQVLAIPRVQSGPLRGGLSDEHGRWRIVGLPRGTYDLEARRPNWSSELPDAALEGVDSCGVEEHILHFTGPSAGGFLSGQVVLQDSNAERRVEVCAQRPRVHGSHCAEPQADGPKFRIGPLASGNYELLVKVDGKVVLRAASNTGVRDGQVVDVGRIVVPPLSSIRVRTIAGSSSPAIAQVTIAVEPIEDWQVAHDLRGRYANATLGESVVLDLFAPGRHRLRCSGNGVAEVQRLVTISGPGEQLEEVVLEEGAFLPVSVHATGIDAGGARVELTASRESGAEPALAQSFFVGGHEPTWSGLSLAEGDWRIRIAHAGEPLAEQRIEVRRDERGQLGSTPLQPFVLELERAAGAR